MLPHISRRTFFGAAAGAAAAAPAMAKDVAKHGLGGNYRPKVVCDYDTGCQQEPMYDSKFFDAYIEHLRREAKDGYRRYGASVLDPDLAALRSVSNAVKLTLQVERDFRRAVLDRRGTYGEEFIRYARRVLGF